MREEELLFTEELKRGKGEERPMTCLARSSGKKRDFLVFWERTRAFPAVGKKDGGPGMRGKKRRRYRFGEKVST